MLVYVFLYAVRIMANQACKVCVCVSKKKADVIKAQICIK